MSKFAQVKKALQDNPDIVIVGIHQENYLPDRSARYENCGYIVDIVVAPKAGSKDTAKELQEFMIKLASGTKPTVVTNFWDAGYMIGLGNILYCEDIGTETIRNEIIIDDKSIPLPDGFIDSRFVGECTQKIQRWLWVHPYPNIRAATEAFKNSRFRGLNFIHK